MCFSVKKKRRANEVRGLPFETFKMHFFGVANDSGEVNHKMKYRVSDRAS